MAQHEDHLRNAKSILAKARATKRKGEKFKLLMRAIIHADRAMVRAPKSEGEGRRRHVSPMFIATADQVRGEAVAELQGMCGIRKEPVFSPSTVPVGGSGEVNPSKSAEYGALGAGAGALLLGPVGAIAGGYFGAKEGTKKKRKPKKNPDSRRILRNAMKGT